MYNTLSILIPAYNEEATIFQILEKIQGVVLPNGMAKEIIVVDDASQDNTKGEVEQFRQKYPETSLVYSCHEQNHGKGYAIRTAIGLATGDVMVVQDADLEYDPADYIPLLDYMHEHDSKVVYGSRFLNKQNSHSYMTFYWGGRTVSAITNLLYGQHLTDEPTCYKMFDSSLLKSIHLVCEGFEFCPEVTAKVAKLGYKIPEIPIKYYPRSIDEGKKISWKDGLEAIFTLIKYRFKS